MLCHDSGNVVWVSCCEVWEQCTNMYKIQVCNKMPKRCCCVSECLQPHMKWSCPICWYIEADCPMHTCQHVFENRTIFTMCLKTHNVTIICNEKHNMVSYAHVIWMFSHIKMLFYTPTSMRNCNIQIAHSAMSKVFYFMRFHYAEKFFCVWFCENLIALLWLCFFQFWLISFHSIKK